MSEIGNMEKPIVKKKSRKIRCTQEFNQLDRTSLATPSSKSESEKKSITKKNKNLSYLPKIYFYDEPVKENCSPNRNENITKKSKKETRAFDIQSLESTEMKARCISGTSTEDDKGDSEIEFKKKKKRRKQKKQTEPKHVPSPDIISGNETEIIDTNKTSVVKKTPAKLSLIDFDSLKHPMTLQANEKSFVNEGSGDDEKTRNSVLKVNKLANSFICKSMTMEHPARKSRNSISKAHKSFGGPTSDQTFECIIPKSISMECNTRKSKNSASKARRSTVHTSESLAPTPLSSDGISDDVFGENFNNDTLIIFPDTKYKDSQNNSNEKISMFDISGLSFAKESHHSVKSVNPDGKRSVRFTTQPPERRSKSLDDSHNMSKRKSTFMTPAKNTSLKVGSSIEPTKSWSSSNRSVSFASVDYRRSKSLYEDNSKIFPKSPYIPRASKTSNLICTDVNTNCDISESESSDESDYLQDESSPIVPQKRKSTSYSDKKSVSFFTPENNNKNKSKRSFKKSPFVQRSTLDQSFDSSVDLCSNSLNNETFELTSPTIELETLKNKSVSTSPTTSSLSEKNSDTFALNKCIINLVTPSPQNETKRTDSFSLSLQNLLSTNDDMYKTTGSFGDSKSDSEMKVTKRKRWNKSLGVSIMDSEGILHDISCNGRETNVFEFCNEHNYSRDSFLSPIKKIDSAKKSLSAGCSSTNKPMSTKKIQEELDESSGIIQPKIAETLGMTFSPLKNESPKRPFQIQPKPSTSKLENKAAVKRTKLPNFALIHQRALDKLEDVSEMSQRKAARAQQLLSGKKPGPDTNMKLPPSNLKIKTPVLKIKSPKSRKLLRYSLKKRQSPEKIEIIKSPTATITVIKTQTKITPSTSNSIKISKPVQKKVIRSHIPKPLNADKKPLSKLGFKVGPAGNNKALRQEDLKAAANKTQPKKNTLETRRNVIQNVRTNRRFELLMKMRNKKD